MNYAEYLKSIGASEEDVKILDTATGRKAFDNLQTQAANNAAEAARQKAITDKYQAEVDAYYATQEANFKTVESQLVASKANESKYLSALKTAHERGMLDVAKDLGLNFDAPPDPNKNNNNNAPPFDASKYVTTENVLALAEKEAESIALMSDIAAEHVYLTGQPLRNARELRAEAKQRKLSLEAVWMEKFNIPKLRTEKEEAARKASEDLIRKDERDKVTSEFASRMGNPDARPLEPSRSFLTPRPTANREKAPWETGLVDESASNDRVKRATQNAIKAGVH